MTAPKDNDIPIPYIAERLVLVEDAPVWRTRPRSLFPPGLRGDREWKRWNARHAGKRAGSRGIRVRIGSSRKHPPEEPQICLKIGDRRRFLEEHRVIFALVHGRWPEDQLDHINRNHAANRIDNLREATNSQNSQNKELNRNNQSGVKGVWWNKKSGMWYAQIGVDYRNLHLGSFASFKDACIARFDAEILHYPFRPRSKPLDPKTIIPDHDIVTGVYRIDSKPKRITFTFAEER